MNYCLRLSSHYCFVVAIAFFSIAFAPRAHAQLDSFRVIAGFTLPQMDSLLQTAGLIPGILVPEYELDVYKVYYTTDDPQGNPTQATGAVVIPRNAFCTLPLCSYQHGTVSQKTQAPSYLSYELPIGLAYATLGNVVALPDYLGLGDSPGLHPYHHTATEAGAVIDLLRATRQICDSLSFPLNEQIFLFGYSQGGHATMAAHKYIQLYHAGEMEVTASAPMSGAYDLSGTQASPFLNPVPYPAPMYLPFILMAYQSVYGNLYTDISDVLVPPYDTFLPPLFDGNYSAGYINSLCPSIPGDMVVPSQLVDFANNPNNPFKQALQLNDLYNDWYPEAPVELMYCNGDQEVFYQNSVLAYNSFVAAGAPSVAAIDFGNFGHNDCVLFCLLEGRNFFDLYRNDNNSMSINILNITPASQPGVADGSVTIEAQGSQAPYTYAWNTGETSATLSQVVSGFYEVTITDAFGCAYTETVTIGLISGIASTGLATAPLIVFPNPATDVAYLGLDNIAGPLQHLRVYNSLGELVKEVQQLPNTRYALDIEGLPAGVYLVEVQGEMLWRAKLLVR